MRGRCAGAQAPHRCERACRTGHFISTQEPVQDFETFVKHMSMDSRVRGFAKAALFSPGIAAWPDASIAHWNAAPGGQRFRGGALKASP